jgi:hypothetical protein
MAILNSAFLTAGWLNRIAHPRLSQSPYVGTERVHDAMDV